MAQTFRDPPFTKGDRKACHTQLGYGGPIAPEYQFERPAIDRLLDFLSYQESRKPAIDILIQEYLERIDSPSTYYRETMGPISPLMDINLKGEHDGKNTSSQQTQTPQRNLHYYPSIPTFYPTPATSSNDIMYDPHSEFRNTASTPLLPPLAARPYRSSSVATDGLASTPSTRASLSSNSDVPIIERLMHGNNSQDNRLKRAAAQERRQATRHFGKVQPGLIWTSPLPVRPRTFSIRPPSLSCKIFLGGIPHDLNPSRADRRFVLNVDLSFAQEICRNDWKALVPFD